MFFVGLSGLMHTIKQEILKSCQKVLRASNIKTTILSKKNNNFRIIVSQSKHNKQSISLPQENINVVITYSHSSMLQSMFQLIKSFETN